MGRYQLVERIGEGGTGVVWRCFDQDLEESVAIKFLREEVARNDSVRAGFRREIKLSRRVTHPNVARVYEFGRDGNAYFLTMEYVAGESLESLLAREGRRPLEHVAALARGLCRGLAAAHVADVVHGDIKPGNILIDPTRGAVLTDFGIARALTEAHEAVESSSGSPLYMSPERLAGGEVTLASDVYAVGVVLFEALTGRLPWSAHHHAALLAAKSSGDPDLHALAPELPAPWARLLGDCLRGEGASRPPDARALLARLAELSTPIRDEVLGSPAPAPGDQPGPRWLEILPFDGDDPTDSGAAWVTGDLVHALAHVPGLRVITSGAESPTKSSHTRIRGEVRATDSGLVVSVQLVDTVSARSTAEFELHEASGDLHNLGVDLASRIAATVDPWQATRLPSRHPDLDPESADLYIQARAAELSMRPGEAIRLYEAALARTPGHRLLQIGHLQARIHALFLAREPSSREIAEVRALAEAAVLRHGDLGDTHLAMAGVAICTNDPIACAAALRQALRCAPGLMQAHALVADLLVEIGRLPDATRRLDIASALRPDSAQVWICRARLYAAEGRWDDYYAIVTGPQAALKFRTAATLRFAMWHPDPAALARIADDLADNRDALPPSLLADARDVVAFARGEDRPAILARFTDAHPGTGSSRFDRVFAQIQCEMACTLGDIPRALACLGYADRLTLIDWHWLVHCPALAVLHHEPTYLAVREHVRTRADSVADALWTGDT